jgi:hypothetical protein
MEGIKFNRIWAMPSKNTFSIPPIQSMVKRIVHGKSIDPFANRSRYASITNDIDPAMQADYCMDALEFLQMFGDGSIDVVLYDPPYSSRQVSECYKAMDMAVNMETTQGSFWTKLKTEIARITKHDGLVLSCGWQSGGIGKTHGFDIEEILLVPHGGIHNDTIVVLERKTLSQGCIFNGGIA